MTSAVIGLAWHWCGVACISSVEVRASANTAVRSIIVIGGAMAAAMGLGIAREGLVACCTTPICGARAFAAVTIVRIVCGTAAVAISFC